MGDKTVRSPLSSVRGVVVVVVEVLVLEVLVLGVLVVSMLFPEVVGTGLGPDEPQAPESMEMAAAAAINLLPLPPLPGLKLTVRGSMDGTILLLAPTGRAGQLGRARGQYCPVPVREAGRRSNAMPRLGYRTLSSGAASHRAV